MSNKINYRKTLIACYLGFITQAIAANFSPLLFVTFHESYGISLGRIALISTLFYFTQLIIDFFCAKYVDRIGYRRSVVASEVLSVAGLVGLAFLPDLLPNAYAGILICTITYAIGSGLIEVLVSPIVEACPFDNKASVMSLLHSFYCWGVVGVIALSTLFFAVFGIQNWRILSCLWAIIPFVNIFNFATCPIVPIVEDGAGMSIGALLKSRLFWVMIILMICAGSSELAMAQWASAFTESALHVSKSIGDLAGPGGFAVLMGTSRALYGKFGEKINLKLFMLFSGVLCVVCYLMAGLSGNPVIGLVGCAVCGFSVGIMWPGSISISSGALPRGGTAMFALLALSGDLGGSVGPGLVGMISDRAGGNLQNGMLLGLIFPAILVVCVAGLLLRDRKIKTA